MTFGQGQGNFFIDNPDAVAQIIGTRLQLWRGQWFLSLSDGIPYVQKIVSKGPPNAPPNAVSLASSILRSAVAASPGVQSIGSFSVGYDPSTRAFTATISDVNTIFGMIDQTTVTTVPAS